MAKEYIISIIIIALGLLAGYILGKAFKKEIKHGKKYLMALQQGLFTASIFLVMYEYKTIIHFIWIGALILFLYYYYHKKLSNILVYALLGALAFISYDYFLPTAGLQFLYGLATGSLNIKKPGLLLKCGLTYSIIAIGLFLLI